MKNLTFTEAKELLNLTDRDSLESFINNEDNYHTTYRIFTEDDALNEVFNMYEGDTYMLGCFNADFISNFIDLDYEDIRTMQESGHHEIIGKLILNSGNYEDMINDYIRSDGWGHALNSYDGNYAEYNDLIIIRQN